MTLTVVKPTIGGGTTPPAIWIPGVGYALWQSGAVTGTETTGERYAAGIVTIADPTNPSQQATVSPSGALTMTATISGLVPAGANTALSSPPAQTNAGSDTSLTFSATVNHWTLQNNSSANLYYNLDAAASTGTLVLAPNAQVFYDWPVTVVHVYTAAAINVNGASGLCLMGRA